MSLGSSTVELEAAPAHHHLDLTDCRNDRYLYAPASRKAELWRAADRHLTGCQPPTQRTGMPGKLRAVAVRRSIHLYSSYLADQLNGSVSGEDAVTLL